MKIEVLYPELCNLYAELENPKYLAASCGAELVYTSLGETPRFVREDIALVTMGTTTERGQEAVRDAFRPWLEDLKRRTEDGGVTLITGNAMEIFGKYIKTDNGQEIPMLGLFDIHSSRSFLQRYNALYLGTFEDIKVVGFKSQFGHSWGNVGEGLFKTLRGAGLHPGESAEGVRTGNLMATYVQGPLLILNPLFSKKLLRMMGVPSPALAHEEAAMDAYRARLAEFEDMKRGTVYSEITLE